MEYDDRLNLIENAEGDQVDDFVNNTGPATAGFSINNAVDDEHDEDEIREIDFTNTYRNIK